MMTTLSFTTFIGVGYKIDLKTTFTVLTFFNIIKVTIDN